MVLSRLKLLNFRQYQKLELQFKDGITGIVGRNGSGKSTILEAVLWCLFGNRAARTGKEGIKRQAAPDTDPCTVRLEFDLKGVTYYLTRSLVGKNHRSEASLSQMGQLDAVSTREVDDYVVRLIGLNLKGFLASFFARQKELNALSEARPADRKDHLAKMLGVGRLDSAIQLLKDEIKAIRQKIDLLGSLQIDPEAVGAELEQKKSEIAILDELKGSLAKNLAELDSAIKKQMQSVEGMRRLEQEFNALENKQATLDVRKEAVEKEISRFTVELSELQGITAKLGPLKIESEGIENLEKEVAGLRQAKVQLQERKRLEGESSDLKKAEENQTEAQSVASETISSLQKSLEGKAATIRDTSRLEKEIESLLNGHQELASDLRVVEDKLATMVKQKSEIDELGPEASCKLCLRPFAGELDEIERHFDQEILSLRHQSQPMAKRLEEIKEAGQKLRQELKLKKDRLEQFNKYEQELASTQAGLKALVIAQEDRQRRATDAEKRLGEIGDVDFDPKLLSQKELALNDRHKKREEYIRLKERAGRKPDLDDKLAKARDDMEALAGELVKNQAQISGLGFGRAAFQQAITELEGGREKASGIRVEIEKNEGSLRLASSEAESKAQKLVEFEKSQKEIGQLRESLTYLEKLSILFTEFRVYLIGRIRPSLSKRTSQLFHEMTEGRYQEIELDEDYNLRVYDRGEHFPIHRFSGGEVDLANLCFRLAISIQMASTAGIEQSFIILDEIFGSQDTERQRMIFDGLGKLKNQFRQIIIISHIDDVKEMAENIISVNVDGSGISRAAAVEN